MTETGVLLLNMGGPESTEDVKGYLYKLLSDSDIVEFPFAQKVFAWMISRLRANKVRKKYETIGGGSPLVELSQKQAELLDDLLTDKGLNVEVRSIMRYCAPRAEPVLREFKNNKTEELIVLPLYPHYSKTTTGSAFNDIERSFESLAYHPETVWIDSWYDHSAYIELLASMIDKKREDEHVIFSAHGLPEKIVKKGDPYIDHIESTVRAVVNKQNIEQWTLSYQSAAGPLKWVEPYTEDILKKLAGENVDSVLVVPISFVTGNLETLWDIDIEFRELAEDLGFKRFKRLETFNCDERFIEVLGRIVMEYLEEEE